MATSPQECARAVRAGLARPAAAARQPRTDEAAAAFSGLLAISVAQAPPSGLPVPEEGAGPTAAATVAAWPFAPATCVAGPSSAPPAAPLPTATWTPTPAAPPAVPGDPTAALAAPPTAVATPATPPSPEQAPAAAPALASPTALPATVAAAAVAASPPARPAAAASAPALPELEPISAGSAGAIDRTAAPGTYASTAAASPEPASLTAVPATPVATTQAAPTPASDGQIDPAPQATQPAVGPATASPPTAAGPGRSQAEAWLAANVALAAAFAPAGEGAAFAATGTFGTADAVADGPGGAGRAAAGDPPASVSRQVTIELLKLSGDDATAPAGRLTLRLDPPQLGRVEVSFEQQGGRLLVTLTAQTPEAERALRNGAGELQQALAGAGGRWHDAQVKVEPATGRDDPQPDGGDESGDQGEQPSRRRRQRDDG